MRFGREAAGGSSVPVSRRKSSDFGFWILDFGLLVFGIRLLSLSLKIQFRAALGQRADPENKAGPIRLADCSARIQQVKSMAAFQQLFVRGHEEVRVQQALRFPFMIGE